MIGESPTRELAGYYHPATRRIILPADASAYVRAHEEAHAQQHARHSIVFYFWLATWCFPWIRNVSLFLIELDADLIARAQMKARGEWDGTAAAESRRVMRSYLRRLLRL